MRRELTREEEEVLRRKRVVLVFSFGRGARLASARAERAFLGLLGIISNEIFSQEV